MAGYNRGIVATRKLNEKNKARLRSTGDTEFGFIKGRLSHINKEEKGRLTAADAYDISLRERVENDIAEKGAGTINPFTGMPEYWDPLQDATDWLYKKFVTPKVVEQMEPALEKVIYRHQGGATGRQDYETLSGMSPEDLEAYYKDAFDLGDDDYSSYITPFQDEPFQFLRDERALTGKRITLGGDVLDKTRELTLAGLKGTYEDTTGALASQQATLKGQYEDVTGALTGQQAALGRTTSRAAGQATAGGAMAMGRSGLASSGTITSGLKQQMQALTTDYAAGAQDIGRQRRSATRTYGIGTQDISRQRESAARDYGLGQETAQADWSFGHAGYKLDRKAMRDTFAKGTWLEENRQLGQFYDEVGDIPA